MASLLEFYQDAEGRENVQAYLKEFLEKMALERLFDTKSDMAGFYEAKKLIDDAFENLNILFDPKPKKVDQSPR